MNWLRRYLESRRVNHENAVIAAQQRQIQRLQNERDSANQQVELLTATLMHEHARRKAETALWVRLARENSDGPAPMPLPGIPAHRR